MKIGKFEINEQSAPYIIAEAGVNHNGSYDLAVKLVDKAVEAGAHAIKWQIYKAETLCVRKAPRFWSWEGETVKDGSQFDSYSKLDKFPLEDYARLAKYCKSKGIEFLATPFDEEAVEFLESLQVSAYKIASCDCTNIPFLKLVAKTGKPIILSTGAASLGDIEEAVQVIRANGKSEIALLHCILKYPTADENANLAMIATLKSLFPGVVVGFSDHTLGTAVPIASVAFGAQIIEKHYTVDKTLPLSADHWLSVDPTELKEIVTGTAKVKKAVGMPWARPLSVEDAARDNARRSVVAKIEIPRGTTIGPQHLTCKRPGLGMHPKFLEQLIGRKAKANIPMDSLVNFEDFE